MLCVSHIFTYIGSILFDMGIAGKFAYFFELLFVEMQSTVAHSDSIKHFWVLDRFHWGKLKIWSGSPFPQSSVEVFLIQILKLNLIQTVLSNANLISF